MALETLKETKIIDGFPVERIVNFEFELEGEFSEDELKEVGVAIHDKGNTIVFKIQNGPIKENGVNGCQVDTMVHACLMIIEELDKKFPCKENDTCIWHLRRAYMLLKERKRNREARGVEGENKA